MCVVYVTERIWEAELCKRTGVSDLLFLEAVKVVDSYTFFLKIRSCPPVPAVTFCVYETNVSPLL